MRKTQCPIRVKTGKTHREQMFSAVHPVTDITKLERHVPKVPCVDGSGLAREIFTSQAWSVQPITAGHFSTASVNFGRRRVSK
jgi:hypothetical protein